MRPCKRILILSLALGLLPALSACGTLGYYMQSIEGHLDLMSRTRPIDEVLANAQLDATLEQRLNLALEARRYAVTHLGLPDNESYLNYADLRRPYAVWNVIATEPFSVEPMQWCFLFVGCIQYRGYFDKDEATAYAAQLSDQGQDTYVAGARAYSTLGWFDDPLLNTMVQQSEDRLIGVIFHELAHQQLYVSDDSAFNEAFATTVEREGVRRWYADRQQPQQYAAYMLNEQRQRAFHDLLLQTRAQLEGIFASELSPQAKRAAKAAAFARLRENYRHWKAQTHYDGYDEWMAQPLNNAHLALVATYNDLVPHFQALLKELRYDLNAFYAVAQTYADLPKEARVRRLRGHTEKGTPYALETIQAAD